jgi:twitching motility protein PilT
LSRLDPLVDALKKTEADEVRLVAGERIYLMRAGRRIEIGREPLQQASLLALAGEVLDPKDLVAVQKEKRSAQVERKGEPIEVTVQTVAGVLTISVKRAPPLKTAAPPVPVAPKPEQGAYASVPAMAAVRPPSSSSNHLAHPIDELLEEMMSKSASDLHLTSGSSPVLRVHGEIHFLTERPVLTSQAIMALVTPILNDKAKRDFEEKHDADFAYEVPGLARFRVNVFVDRIGVGAVMRQIPIEIIPADKLGLPQAVLDLCFLTKGLVVVTGPTGSGKSTTLAGMVDFINKNRSDHIITIEDPIEFVHKNIKCLVNQREVGQHTKSFKNALRAALREDPDIVLVGEMRDLETISIAIETAETGHLVFGTLHTTTAISTVDRIIDQFPTDQQEQIRVMLAESLKGVIAQVLCKKIGGGRVAAMEILLGNSAVTSLIREAKTFQIPSIMQTSRGAGMVTMNDSLLALVQKKLVDPKEAWMKSVDKSGLVGMLKSAGIQLQTT